ncbi:MAG TPA: serine/threonine-protein kinase, partial [Polyangia bacterium]|nr:serine/threonine-protein kinase [Polyangia bacterium]
MKGFPRRFGPYVLAKPLARGGMGALYLAVRPDRKPDVCVIKTVLPHLADKEYLQRFRDEGKVVVQLSHANLVPVFDSGRVGGEIFLGMEFVDGRDLRAIWNRCAKKGVAFPIDVAVYLVRELALGLQYAHTFGDIKLVHRDVSPPNVLVAFDGSVKLTDFGLASSTLKLEKTAPGIIYGKVSYMSPEQARGEPLDGRTDLFAAGIILWELLTGRQVYPAKTPRAAEGDGEPAGRGASNDAEELLRRVRRPVILPPSQRASRVTPELDRVALQALAPKLADRYVDCAALARDLTAYL